MSSIRRNLQKRRAQLGTAAALIAGALAACGGDTVGGTGGASGAGTGGIGGAATPLAVVGTFLVTLAPATGTVPAQTALSGKVYNAATPVTIGWEQLEQAGGCQLLKPKIPFCNPACTGGQVCDVSGSCLSQPVAVDVGTLTVSGIGSGAMSVKPVLGGYQLGELPNPPAPEGAPIRVSAPGGTLGPLAIEAAAVAPLVFTEMHALKRDEILALRWTPPANVTSSRMLVKLDVSHHAGTKGKIECDVADSGALDVPATMITKLLALGVAQDPTILLTRASVGRVAVSNGIVELRVESPVDQPVTIP